jgi:hypothetical protein
MVPRLLFSIVPPDVNDRRMNQTAGRIGFRVGEDFIHWPLLHYHAAV